jgi:hypothetical protein
MLIKEYGLTWPPTRAPVSPSTMVGDIATTANLDDVVVSIKRCTYPKGLLLLTLRDKSNKAYPATFLVPEFLDENIILTILRQEAMTLREVGELPIPETSSVDELLSTEPPASSPKQPRRKLLSGFLRPWFAFGRVD